MSTPTRSVRAELKRLIDEFFYAVSFNEGEEPSYSKLHDLFIEPGLLIKNSGAVPEISLVNEFIQSRQALVDAGELTYFHEAEIVDATEDFGNVAQRFSAYTKSGTLKGISFRARGMVSTQFILTPRGWMISSMAWDDERAELKIPKHFAPKE